ncbi:substrate-binding domain-containing protein [Apibacter raozihei]|uniref:substrate-binding domain-containing protein n=1 Tax=Apibacter raozihei TaxID=2500547 RepID=UPI0013E3C811|nr:substrate-binding domain-containing protein [Apibacter raozihei]
MSKIIKFYSVVLLAAILINCQKDIKKKENYRKGKLTLAIDPSFLNLGNALVDVFHSSYPEAHISLKAEVEDLAIADLVNGKVKMVIVGRDLTQSEAQILYNKRKIKCISAQIACDATIFITSVTSDIDKIYLNDIRQNIFSSDSKFVFDNGNSSNYNNILRKLNIQQDKNRKLIAFTNSNDVIDFVSNNKSHIGIIGFDVLSDQSDPKVKNLLKKVKILPVVDSNDKLVFPTVPNLRENIYPFTKRVFLLNAEGDFLIGSSFARFSGSQRGQLIVTRAGLQPYYLYKRRVEVH